MSLVAAHDVNRQKISNVYNALSNAGCTVERMIEPGSPDPANHDLGPWGKSSGVASKAAERFHHQSADPRLIGLSWCRQLRGRCSPISAPKIG
ncbi:hypothetical protein ACFQJ8_22780 [Halocatena marina]|uniref:hypothetical protein n=1 Tax=Halocatena marina TaxID=2934937 RepID=UPI00360CAA28